MKTTKPVLLMTSPNLEMFLVGLNKFWYNPGDIKIEGEKIIVNGKTKENLKVVHKRGRIRLEMLS